LSWLVAEEGGGAYPVEQEQVGSKRKKVWLKLWIEKQAKRL
jgi:hypothetical protein